MPSADASTFSGPIAVTLVYLGLYYGFQLNILRVKLTLAKAYKHRGEAFDRYFGQDRHMLAADRLQLNTLEHMPPFLALLWLNAVFVDARTAAIAGSVYLGTRALYPALIGKRLGRDIKPIVIVATWAGYLVLAYYVVMLVLALR